MNVIPRRKATRDLLYGPLRPSTTPCSVSHQLFEKRKGRKQPEKPGELQRAATTLSKDRYRSFAVSGSFTLFPAFSFFPSVDGLPLPESPTV
jgi:hypothetical protein